MLISGKRLEKKNRKKPCCQNCQKHRGVTIDNRLNYEEHIDRLCRNVF